MTQEMPHDISRYRESLLRRVIQHAVEAGDIPRLEALIAEWRSQKKENEVMGSKFYAAVRQAIGNHDAAALAVFMKAGHDISSGDVRLILRHITQTNDTRLLEAVVDSGWDPNLGLCGHQGGILHFAVLFKSYPAVALLLSSGADPNTDVIEATPLERAAFNAPIDVIDLLIEYGAQFKDRTVLLTAARRGRINVVESLLRNGQDINFIPDNADAVGRSWFETVGTALYESAESGQLDMVRFLVDHRADIDIKSRGGLTASEIARENGHNDVVEFLAEVSPMSGVKTDKAIL